MASKKPYYTSNDLIEAVKRKMAFPISQVTFTNDNILEFATEELFMSQVPSVLQYHEEYFVTDKIVPLVANQSRYDIPDRAIGMKLRDLYFQDTNGNLHQMVNVGPSNDYFFGNNSNGYQNPRNYCLESNEIVLKPNVGPGVTGSLVIKYYLRPNSLVENSRAAISNSFVKDITIDNSYIVAGDKVSLAGQVLTAGTDFAIGATSTATATNLATAINSLSTISASSATNILEVFYQTLSSTFTTTNPSAFIINPKIGIQCDSIPENFTDNMLVDFMQTGGGHSTLAFDVRVGDNSIGSDTIFFNANDIPSKFVIGDYICEQYESIIPQIPNDLHTLLAERTCMRILEALGDTQGVQTQTAKVSDLEARQATMIDNRTEGSPRKVFNKNSLLRLGKSRRIRRGIF